jgi:hypothetical protein
LSSLRSSAIDPAFHYAGVRQADLWLKVHQAHAPGSLDEDFERIYRDLADDVARTLRGETVHVIGLGPGGGEKEAWVLQALQRHGCRVRYTPVDISPELALQSAETAEALTGCPSYPVVGDLSMLTEQPDWLADSDETRLYTAFGLTPNFRPSALLGVLRVVLRRQDHLLISANLAPVVVDDDADYRRACTSVIGQYDNHETREWLKEVLIEWGIAPMLSEPVFDISELEGIGGFFANSQWLTDAQFEVDGETFTVTAGDRLRLFFSLRYTRRRLESTLSEYGLRIDHGYEAANGQEGVYLAAPAR